MKRWLINNKDIKVLETYGKKTDIENYRKISKYENINFAVETHAIAQMKVLLILIKSYKRHICQKNDILSSFSSPNAENEPKIRKLSLFKISIL